MPYVTQERRKFFAPELDQLTIGAYDWKAGDLNYLITKLVLAYLAGDARDKRPPNYERYNSAVGVLECAKLEVYRQWVAPYEDGKRTINGGIE